MKQTNPTNRSLFMFSTAHRTRTTTTKRANTHWEPPIRSSIECNIPFFATCQKANIMPGDSLLFQIDTSSNISCEYCKHSRTKANEMNNIPSAVFWMVKCFPFILYLSRTYIFRLTIRKYLHHIHKIVIVWLIFTPMNSDTMYIYIYLSDFFLQIKSLT